MALNYFALRINSKHAKVSGFRRTRFAKELKINLLFPRLRQRDDGTITRALCRLIAFGLIESAPSYDAPVIAQHAIVLIPDGK